MCVFDIICAICDWTRAQAFIYFTLIYYIKIAVFSLMVSFAVTGHL